MEMNFDGIVGPTHNYGGLSYGNIASMGHSHHPSNPKAAALQGLAKMHALMSLGIAQGVLPPQERPLIPVLQSLGFTGNGGDVIEKAWRVDKNLVIDLSSAASMWAANAATVSPSADSDDGKIHFTPANLQTKFHRSFEAVATGKVLQIIFGDPAYFSHHEPLLHHLYFADEGAANHTRFCREFDKPGIQFFVYGKRALHEDPFAPKKFPARQSEESSRAIARIHQLSSSRVYFAQQHPDAIDAGVFHNDVISVGHQNVFLYHESAFIRTNEVVNRLGDLVEEYCQVPFIPLTVRESDISLKEAVRSYFFNSQIVTLPDQTMALIAPDECESSPEVKSFIDRLLADPRQPIRQVLYQNIRESMQNGGGPACLRLRVAMNRREYEAIHKPVCLTEELYQTLVNWVKKHYRDHLITDDLRDPLLLIEVYSALDELSSLLQLGPIYVFQK